MRARQLRIPIQTLGDILAFIPIGDELHASSPLSSDAESDSSAAEDSDHPPSSPSTSESESSDSEAGTSAKPARKRKGTGLGRRTGEWLSTAHTTLETWRDSVWEELYSSCIWGPTTLLPDKVLTSLATWHKLKDVDGIRENLPEWSYAATHGRDVLHALQPVDQQYTRSKTDKAAQKAAESAQKKVARDEERNLQRRQSSTAKKRPRLSIAPPAFVPAQAGPSSAHRSASTPASTSNSTTASPVASSSTSSAAVHTPAAPAFVYPPWGAYPQYPYTAYSAGAQQHAAQGFPYMPYTYPTQQQPGPYMQPQVPQIHSDSVTNAVDTTAADNVPGQTNVDDEI